MDTLSRLLELYPVRTALDVRCHFGAPWVLDQGVSAFGTVPYHLILNGSADLNGLNGKSAGATLQAGDIVVFPHGTAHRLQLSGEGPLTSAYEIPGHPLVRMVRNDGAGPATDILCGEFHFDSHAAKDLLATLPSVLVVHSANRNDFSGLRELMAMLQYETELMRPGARIVVAQLASALFALVMRAWLEQAPSHPGLFALLAEKRLQPAVRALMDAPEEPWTLEKLAGLCSMSRPTFARLFQRAADDTPARVLQQWRMARAAELLAHGRQSVGAIAEAVGYQSEAAFNRVFTRCYGVGPGRYRRDAGFRG